MAAIPMHPWVIGQVLQAPQHAAGLELEGALSPDLREINVMWRYEIADVALQCIAEECPNLASLNAEACFKVTDAGLQFIANGCPNLTSLVVGRCYTVTDLGLQSIAESCHGLLSLGVEYCDITDAGLQHIARGCPNLVVFDVGRCNRITDAGLEHIAEGCKGLTSLSVQGRNQITDAGLASIARNCPKLTTLNIEACAAVTDEGLRSIARGCPDLQALNVELCQQITDAGLVTVAETCPKLTILNGVSTPLAWACDMGNLRLAQLLIDRGADVQALDQHGRTVLDVAVLTNKPEDLLELLFRAGMQASGALAVVGREEWLFDHPALACRLTNWVHAVLAEHDGLFLAVWGMMHERSGSAHLWQLSGIPGLRILAAEFVGAECRRQVLANLREALLVLGGLFEGM